MCCAILSWLFTNPVVDQVEIRSAIVCKDGAKHRVYLDNTRDISLASEYNTQPVLTYLIALLQLPAGQNL
jgi:hypothetical protein